MSNIDNIYESTPTVYDVDSIDRLVDDKLSKLDDLTVPNITVTNKATINTLVLDGWEVTVVE